MNKYGELRCSGNENGITYEIFLDSNFKYTIVVRKGEVEKISRHQGIIAIFGEDSLDVALINKMLDDMINELSK